MEGDSTVPSPFEAEFAVFRGFIRCPQSDIRLCLSDNILVQSEFEY